MRRTTVGIIVTGSGNTIGGVGNGNLVSGNGHRRDPGRRLGGAHDNVISANLIGTDATGNLSLSNQTSESRRSTAHCTR